jgi:hypothetical protein
MSNELCDCYNLGEHADTCPVYHAQHEPKAEPPDNATTHNSARYGETVGNCEPKASPSLQDAGKFLTNLGYGDLHEMWICEAMASFARQQRRDAVAEFVRRLTQAFEIGGTHYPEDWKDAIEAVAKEMDSE